MSTVYCTVEISIPTLQLHSPNNQCLTLHKPACSRIPPQINNFISNTRRNRSSIISTNSMSSYTVLNLCTQESPQQINNRHK